MELPPVCILCINYLGGAECKAFKDIPPEIWQEGNEHLTPLPSQGNTIVFEPIKDNDNAATD